MFATVKAALCHVFLDGRVPARCDSEDLANEENVN
jgi:hypothetical protein